MSTKEQRRKQLARAKWERQQQRRAARAHRGRRMRVLLSALAVLVIAGGATALVVVNQDDEGTDEAAAAAESSTDPATDAAEPPAEDPCAAPAEGEPSGDQWDEEPAMTIDEGAAYTMTLATTCGDISIALDAEAAPHTVNSFAFLAGEGYFDHTRCHRLVTEGIYVLQCGDPTATGQGGPGYTLPDENLDDPDVAGGVYPAGTVAMANAGADTGGSQFFLVYEDSQLPADYTPFGTVTEGMDVLATIAEAGAAPADPTTGNTAPYATVVIDEATVEPAEDEQAQD